MISAVLDHLWQSTLVAPGVGVLAMAFRKARASVRFALWFAASVKFLLPFALLAGLGRLLSPTLRPPVATVPDAVLIERAAQPFSPPAAAPTTHAATSAASVFDPTLILLAAWALGCAAVLIVWIVRWRKVRAALSGAKPLALDAPMPVLTSSSLLEPGLVGLWSPVLLVPATLVDHLAPAEIQALVAHEACHLRRRDNLTAAIHMLVEALFWFHPLVWWIGARLIDERELACDEAVVRCGHDRATYARSLLETCRLYLQSPLHCVAGASGSNLARRVEMIMTAPTRLPLSRPVKVALVAAGVCALASPVAAGWLTLPSGRQAADRVAAAAARIAEARPAQTPPVTAALPEQSGPPRPMTQAQNEASPPPNSPDTDAQPPTSSSAAESSPAEVSPPVTLVAVPKLTLAPTASISLTKAPLTKVSDQTSGQLLGPGHYEQRSGIKASGDCGGGPERLGPTYMLSTPPIAPGHIITNFHYELRGDNRCNAKWPSAPTTAECGLVTDKPDKKTVVFALLANSNECFSFPTFQTDGSGRASQGSVSVVQPAAVTHSEMVISYDVQ